MPGKFPSTRSFPSLLPGTPQIAPLHRQASRAGTLSLTSSSQVKEAPSSMI